MFHIEPTKGQKNSQKRRQNGVDNRQTFKAMTQRGNVIEGRFDVELIVKHSVKHSQIYVPLDNFGEPSVIPHTRRVQRQVEHFPVDHSYEIIFLSQNPRNNVVLIHLAQDAQPRRRLQVHDAL